MATHRITHVRNRIKQHEYISHLQYGGHVYHREFLIKLIEKGINSYYVEVGGHRSEVIVVHPKKPHKPYLRTHADGTLNDNLLSLPQC